MNPYLDGLLLGDGTIEPYKDVSGRLQVRRMASQADYNGWLKTKMPELLWASDSWHFSKSTIEGRSVVGHQHNIRTQRDRHTLLRERRRWYPDGIKRVPPDLILHPETLAVWFMDDGSFAVTKYRQVCYLINLYTTGFCREDVDLLRSLLLDQQGIQSSVQPQRKSGFCLAISGRLGVTRFLELVRPTVLEVPTMCYKIDVEGKLASAEVKYQARCLH